MTRTANRSGFTGIVPESDKHLPCTGLFTWNCPGI